MRSCTGSWIAYRKAKPKAKRRIFCFPYAGSGASAFRAWDKFLPDKVELCPIQLPGRETRASESAYTRIEPLIDALSRELKPVLDIPYVLFGYSMGALIAFDLARRFNAEAVPGPLHLFLAARRGPRLEDPYPRTENLDENEFVSLLRTIGGTPKAILENPEILQIVLPTLRADFALCENYKYREGTILDCPFTVFGGTTDVKATADTLAAWGPETRSSCSVKMFSGDHFFIHNHHTEILQNILKILSMDELASRQASLV